MHIYGMYSEKLGIYQQVPQYTQTKHPTSRKPSLCLPILYLEKQKNN